jgi:hypothetical protein
MKFLVLDGVLLVNKSLYPGDKMIVSYIHNLSIAGKCFYGSHAFLADQLGMRLDFIEKRISALLEGEILVSSKEGITLNMSFNDICNLDHKLRK